MSFQLRREDGLFSEEHIKHFQSRYKGILTENFDFLNPSPFMSTKQATKMEYKLKTYEVRPTDVYAMSYLKVGSTWIQDVLWAITNNPNLDHPDTDRGVYYHSPWLEVSLIMPEEKIPPFYKERNPDVSFEQMCAELPDPRVFHTHNLFHQLNPDVLNKAKVVYIIRHPADVCLSYFHFARGINLAGYIGTIEDFADDFNSGIVFMGRYIDHLKCWWEKRNHPNVYTIFYEKLKKNTSDEIKKLADFLGYPLTEQQIKNIIHYTSFQEMKKRDPLAKSSKLNDGFLVKNSNGFFRKGKAGAFQDEFTPELRKKVLDSFKSNLGDIELPYDLST